MPYKNIHWIKLETRLLNDPRFFTMSDKAQLLYVKLLLLGGVFNNKIPKNLQILTQVLRLPNNELEIKKVLDEVKNHFPKLIEGKDFYHFRGFKEKHNWVSRGNSQGTPKEAVDKIRIDKIRREQIYDVLCDCQGWDKADLVSSDYARINKSLKSLIERAKGDADLIIEAIKWVSVQGYTWTVETVDKKWPDFIKKGAKSKELRAMEAEYARKSKM